MFHLYAQTPFPSLQSAVASDLNVEVSEASLSDSDDASEEHSVRDFNGVDNSGRQPDLSQIHPH